MSTRSQFSRPGLSVSIDWEVTGRRAVLVATIITDRSASVTLSDDETRNVVRRSADHTRYAETYADMIS